MPDEQIIGTYYRVDSRIGQGGMGTVYRGMDLRTQTPVAIKQLKPDLVKESSEAVQRFAREAEALRQLNHPSIIKIMANITEGDHHYIVMEFISGGSLENLLEKTPQVPVKRVLEIALDLSDALTRAHRLKIIHRDIKPANVLLRDDGLPILTDFGIARMSNSTTVTKTGTVIGTIPYLSPEALYSEMPVDERVDIWAFGVMLYEMLAGVHPFKAETLGVVMNNILTHPVADFHDYRTDIPWPLMGLVYWMLEKNAADRPASVRLIGTMLENLLSGEDISWEAVTHSVQGDRHPTREELIRAVIDYATLKLRPEGKPATPTPTQVMAILEGGPVPTRPQPMVHTPAKMSASWQRVRRNRLYWVPWSLAMILAGLALVLLFVQGPPNGSTPTPLRRIAMPSVPADKHMALVAQFKHVSGETRDVTQFIIQNLKRNLEDDTTYSDVVIREYNEAILDSETAREVAEQTGADVIIWGDYDSERVTANIQVGSTVKYPFLAVEREDLERLSNVMVTMTKERSETLAYNIIAVLNSLAAWNGDAFSVGRNLLMVSLLNDRAATIAQNTIAGHYHRYVGSYVDQPATSVQEMTRAIQLDANNPMLYAVRALGYQRMGDVVKSRADIATAERLAGKDWMPTLLLHSSDALFLESNYPVAIGYLDRFIAQRPSDWYSLSMRGMAYYILGNYEAANADVQAAIALGPEANFPYSIAIAINLRQGNTKGAQDLFHEVLERFPNPRLAQNVLLAALSPDSANNLFVSLSSSFGSVTLQRWDDVLDDVQSSIDTGRELSDPYFLRGLAYCNQKKYDEAESAYTHALDIDPDYGLIYLMRADVRRKKNDAIGTLADLTTALTRPELQSLQPVMTLDNINRLDCETFLDADLSDLRITPTAGA